MLTAHEECIYIYLSQLTKKINEMDIIFTFSVYMALGLKFITPVKLNISLRNL